MNKSHLINKFFSLVEQDQYGNIHAVLNKEWYENNNKIQNISNLTSTQSIKVTSELRKKADVYMVEFIKCIEELKNIAYNINPKNPKAIFIKDVDENFAGNYNLLKSMFFKIREDDYMKLQGYTNEQDNKKSIYLIRNGAYCQEIIEGKVYAAGALIIVNNNGVNYFLVINDSSLHKNKESLVMPNGDCCYQDFVKYNKGADFDNKLYKETAEKKLQEQSKDGNKPNLNVSINNLFVKIKFIIDEKLASKNTKGIQNYPYYLCICATFIKYEKGNNKFLDELFNETNLDRHGNYVLKFSNNNKTELFAAILLDKSILHNVLSIKDYYQLIDQISHPVINIYGNKDKKTILKFHLYTAYLYLAKILGFKVNNFLIDNKTFIEKVFCYPSIKKYEIFDTNF